MDTETTENDTEQATVPVIEPEKAGSKWVPGNKRKHIKDLETVTEPLSKRVDTLRYTSSILAQRLAHEIRLTLDSPLPKKERVRLVRELTWSYGVLLDKAAGGSDSGMVQIKFPAEVLAALKVGIALQVAPKPVEIPQVIVESTS